MDQGNKFLKIYCQKYRKQGVGVPGTQTPISPNSYQIKDYKLQEV